jgi:hypothetical protein
MDKISENYWSASTLSPLPLSSIPQAS